MKQLSLQHHRNVFQGTMEKKLKSILTYFPGQLPTLNLLTFLFCSLDSQVEDGPCLEM